MPEMLVDALVMLCIIIALIVPRYLPPFLLGIPIKDTTEFMLNLFNPAIFYFYKKIKLALSVVCST